jgi:tetratricopeptide (TPR) repeat protein
VAAGSDDDSLAAEAMWQAVVVTDAWYESTRPASTGGAPAPGSDSLALAVVDAAERLLARFPDHPRGGDLIWRAGNLAFAHGRFERAVADFGRMVERYPADARVPRALALSADAFFKLERFEDAGAGYERALAAARRARLDTLATRALQALPVCALRAAEAAVAADSSRHDRHARLFENVAERYPGYQHAAFARYRAGLAWQAAGRRGEAVDAMQALIRDFPNSEYVRDARVRIAHTWEEGGFREKAGEAYVDFAEHHPEDSSAAAAWLTGADLLAAAGKQERADRARLAYIARHPDDVETAMEVMEGLARRELAEVGPQWPISNLLDQPEAPAPKPQRGSRKATPQAVGAQGPPRSYLADYLRRVKRHPELAATDVLAQVAFFRAEEGYDVFAGARLTQPLERSIPAKQKLLDQVIADYKACVALGVAEWAHASTFRIGEALGAFAAALDQSERPADLKGDDLFAYDEVLRKQADVLRARGEDVWAELLRSAKRAAADSEDVWVAQTRKSLHLRLADRFEWRSEGEASAAAEAEPEAGRSGAPDRHSGAPTEDEARRARTARRAAGLNNQGIARLREGKVDEARESFLAAIDVDPALAGPYYNLTIVDKYYRFEDEAAARWFHLYRARANDDPDGLAEVFGLVEPRGLAEGGRTP